jgi:hypothetical protein
MSSHFLTDLFVSLTWGLGLLWGVALLGIVIKASSLRNEETSIKNEEASMSVMAKKMILARSTMSLSNPFSGSGRGIPEKLQELMNMSPNHPEVNEIEEDDEVVGVLFKSNSYPPEMEDSDSEDTDE